jgi:phytoene synthase
MSDPLTAAGVTDPALRAAYLSCRRLNAAHGRTYYLATRLLEPRRRPAVHALYGFARYADDLVDEPAPGTEASEVAGRLDALAQALFSAMSTGRSDHPVLAAVADTARRYGIGAELFGDFLDSMRMDLTVRDYRDRAALEVYMHGSAEVIGLQMLPVLGTVARRADAEPYAAALGKAFQLTNFLRDVAEDLDRGRIYLPGDELAAFGVDRDLLAWCRRNRRTDPRVRAALADQHATTRAVYRFARDGVRLLDPASRPCVDTARMLYSAILDRIEDMDYAVFAHRARAGRARRARLAATGLARAVWARRHPGPPADRTGGSPVERSGWG